MPLSRATLFAGCVANSWSSPPPGISPLRFPPEGRFWWLSAGRGRSGQLASEGTAEPRYTSIIRGQTGFVKWQLPNQTFDVFDVLPALKALPGWTMLTANRQLPSDILSMMPKRTSPSKPAPEQAERTHVTSGINLPVDVYQLLNRVAFSRSLKNGGRPSVSALLVSLVEKHRKELEKELDG